MPPNITNVIACLPRRPNSRSYLTRPIDAIKLIVVHYDEVAVPPSKQGRLAYDPLARYISQANYHINNNWNEDVGPTLRGFGLMYHYRVSADGRIWQTQPDDLILWHARHANFAGLAICCDLGSGQSPPPAQLDGLRALLNHLCCHRPDFPASRGDVFGHSELTTAGNRTPCPGTLLSWVQSYRQAK
jgi:hypothetical protein